MTEEVTFGQAADKFVGGGGGGSNLITYIKERETRLRFAHDWGKFIIAYIHRDDENNTSFPCPGDPNRDKCPGCLGKMKASAKIFAIAMDRDKGYVNVYQLPIGLKEDLARMQDRDGTMQARDITIYKSGAGLDTSYGLEKEDRSAAPEWPDEMPTIQEALLESWKFGTDNEYRASKMKKKDDEEGESIEEMAKAAAEEKPPFDESAKVEEDTPRGDVTEVEIRAMKYLQLVQMAIALGIAVDEDWSKQDLADAIIKN